MDSAILDFYLRIRLVGPWRFKKRQAPWEKPARTPRTYWGVSGREKARKTARWREARASLTAHSFIFSSVWTRLVLPLENQFAYKNVVSHVRHSVPARKSRGKSRSKVKRIGSQYDRYQVWTASILAGPDCLQRRTPWDASSK